LINLIISVLQKKVKPNALLSHNTMDLHRLVAHSV